MTQNDTSLVRALLEEVKEKDRELQVRMGKRYDERKCFKVQLQMEVQKAARFLSDVERKQATTHGSTLNQSTTHPVTQPVSQPASRDTTLLPN